MSDYAQVAPTAHAGTPEELFQINPKYQPGLNIDALLMSLTRARSVLLLLEGSGHDLNEGFDLNHSSVMEALSCVEGLVSQALMIIEGSFASTLTESELAKAAQETKS